MSETRTGIVRGPLYPNRMQGQKITVEVEDEQWGRCHEHSTWVRLEDIEPVPKFAQGGIVNPPGRNFDREMAIRQWTTPTNTIYDSQVLQRTLTAQAQAQSLKHLPLTSDSVDAILHELANLPRSTS